ncbi:MAG: hypothetical protein AB1671_03950 [Thermodesulfobacteriota bacterium]
MASARERQRACWVTRYHCARPGRVAQRPDCQAIDFIARYNGLYEVEYRTQEGRRRTLWLDAVAGTER